MTTETPDEGNQESKGEQEAKPESSTENGQLLSGNLPSVEERLAKLEADNARLQHENQTLQSGKDKRWNEYEPILKLLVGEVGEEKVAELQQKAVLQELVAQRFGPKQPQTPFIGSEQGAAPKSEVQTVIEALSLDPNDPDVNLAMRSENPIAALSELHVKKATKPTLNTSQKPPIEGVPPPPPHKDTKEELTEKYIKEMRANRGKRSILAEIRTKYEHQGVDVFNTDFS